MHPSTFGGAVDDVEDSSDDQTLDDDSGPGKTEEEGKKVPLQSGPITQVKGIVQIKWPFPRTSREMRVKLDRNNFTKLSCYGV